MSAALQTVGDLFRRAAETAPDQTAYELAGIRLSYAEFLRGGLALADALARHAGLREQDRVSVLARNCLEFVESYAAAELAGFILHPINARLAAPEIAYAIGDAEPAAVIFEAEFAPLVDAIRHQCAFVRSWICIGHAPAWADSYAALKAGGDPEGPKLRSRPEHIAYLTYTSGTTGRPKGCIIGQLESALKAEMMAASMRASRDAPMLLMMPFFHVGAKALALGQHVVAGTVHMQRSFDPAAILRCIESERIAITHMAPTMIGELLAAPGIESCDLSSLRVLLYSAAPMPVPLLRRGLALLGPVFLQQYGQTEASVSRLLPEEHRPDGTPAEQARLASVGRPHPGVEIRIADDDDRDVAVGMPGEILVRSAAMMRGYWNRSAATIEALRGGWLHTGDIGRIDGDGYLYLVDRKKDVIISGGENIYSREVEAALATHPAVADVAVIGVADVKWGEAVHAVVVPACAARPDLAEELIAHCRARIAAYKAPKSISLVAALPHLSTGKIDKAALRQAIGGTTQAAGRQ